MSAPESEMGDAPTQAAAAAQPAAGTAPAQPAAGANDPRWERLFARRALGVKLELAEVRRAWTCLGQPLARIRCLQVVGTNGKGSTAAMISHGLMRRGWRVGLYTSPHLVRVGERVRIDGQVIDDAQLLARIDEVLAREPSMGLTRELTFFELLTLAAALQFERDEVDVAVLEAGLGGRLDATTALPVAAVGVARIGLDHQRYLGPDLRSIAREKAGALRPGVRAFTQAQAPEAMDALREAAAQIGAVLRQTRPLPRAPLGLAGEHQRHNGGLALALARIVAPAVTEEDLDGVAWPARLEHARGTQGERWVFDAAHNVDAIASAVAAAAGDPPRLVVFGAPDDRDPAELLAALRGFAAPVWWVWPAQGDVRDACWGGDVGPDRVFVAVDDRLRAAIAQAALEGPGAVWMLGAHRVLGALRGALVAANGVAASGPASGAERWGASDVQPGDPTGSPR